ncbi:hypothetical protein NKG94_17575 [Micromonospora sp. M12]
MRRLRHALAVSFFSLALAVSGCGRDGPLCEYANGLVKDARLTEAANAYAAAQRVARALRRRGADKVADLRRDVTKDVAAGARPWQRGQGQGPERVRGGARH